MEKVLEFAEALAVVLREAVEFRAGRATEEIPLERAAGRELAEDIAAPRAQPPFDRSTRDGYAVRAEDVREGAELRVTGQLRAGKRWQGAAVRAGEAVEIMTGAPLPVGADSVLMVEHAALSDGTLRPATGRTLRAGENVVARGAEAKSGDVLLRSGRRLDAGAVAVAAGCGRQSVRVFARPRVAIVATGDELVELGAGAPREWEIYNSNSYALAALVAAESGEPKRLPIARDTLTDLRARVEAARGTADLLLLSGGVSMGKFDFVEQVLADAGAEFFFTGARIQPGKPVVFGRLPRGTSGWLYFFGLPGNPVSTEVCFRLFVAALLRGSGPTFVEAHVAEAFQGKRGLVRFLPCRLNSDWQSAEVKPVSWQGSGDTAASAAGDGFCVVEERGLAVGDTARVLLR